MSMVELGRIRDLAVALEHAQDGAADAALVVKAAMDAAWDCGLVKAAFRLGVKLRGMEIAKRNDFLRSFDQVREALGLNDQLDLVDAIERDAAEATKRVDAIERSAAEVARRGLMPEAAAPMDGPPPIAEPPDAPAPPPVKAGKPDWLVNTERQLSEAAKPKPKAKATKSKSAPKTRAGLPAGPVKARGRRAAAQAPA